MPSLQVVNTTRDKPDPTAVHQFFSKLGETYKDVRDQDTIGNLISEYQQNRNQANAWEDLQLGLEKSNVGPTKRLQAQQSLNEMRKGITERDKVLNKQAEQVQKEAEKQNTRRALEKSGATPEQIDLYEASPIGGQTKIVENIADKQQRKESTPGLVGEDVEDYDNGLTPKERVKRQDARYSTQTPLVMKNSDSINALESEDLSLGLLKELDETGKVGQGFSKLNINPLNGNLILPGAANPEEQLFVKTVNDFTVKAKDSFGARVTNFELDRFMQRLPTLANSKEGRALIIRQMQIVNHINQLEKKEIQKVFDQYGIRNIDYADAENKARESIKVEKEDLRKEYYNLEQLAKKDENETIKNIKEKVPEGYTPLRKPDGTIRAFPTKNVPNLEEKGYKKI